MKVFVTGATGFVGRAVVKELVDAGHQVLGLTRSEKGAETLTKLGAEAHRGELTDVECLKQGASKSDGVIHLAFKHDFGTAGGDEAANAAKAMANACRIDREAIEAMGTTLAGTNRPFIGTSGTLLMQVVGRPITEDDPADGTFSERGKSEVLALSLAARGVRSAVMRLPPTVHGEEDKGFVSMITNTARERKTASYIEKGDNVWCATHRLDVAAAYRLALEHGSAGKIYHAVAEQGIPTKTIAEAIGKQLGVPTVSITREEAPQYMGFMGVVFGLGNPVSSEKTKAQLKWTPKQRTFLEDIEQGVYTKKN